MTEGSAPSSPGAHRSLFNHCTSCQRRESPSAQCDTHWNKKRAQCSAGRRRGPENNEKREERFERTRRTWMDMACVKTFDLLVGVVLVLQCVRNVHAEIATSYGCSEVVITTSNTSLLIHQPASAIRRTHTQKWAVPYIAESREAGSSPRTSMQQQGRAPALVTPGSRR
ncbi:hypothetical protein D4764_17G0003500 [Takifugu flavidus]|uniref:Uncharacterized protein n=1 Tax=Takifugu flavidus TaxID=433684 RepID=A0A5C6NYQ0_9TELE|nr:hypothetical protein D4764_17G0003500 [Takifugu flavidus]